jgi:hypothetical protein
MGASATVPDRGRMATSFDLLHRIAVLDELDD